MVTLSRQEPKVPSRESIEMLLEEREGPCVSIFIPVHRKGPETQQDQVRVDNSLRLAEEKLVEMGLGVTAAQELLRSGHALTREAGFWQHPGEGLALFISGDVVAHFWLQRSVEERVVVGQRFNIVPLLPSLAGDGRFHILALSQKALRLLDCSRYSVKEIPLPEGVPASMADALKYDDFEKQHLFYSGTPGYGGGKTGAIFYGHGAATDVKKDSILRYFQQIDRRLHDFLRDEHTPLVLAGVDYLLPIYREVNTYAQLLPGGIDGNADEKSVRDLHDAAWVLVQPLFEEHRTSALRRYRQMAGTGLASDDLVGVVLAACYASVDTLLVDPSRQVWGTFAAQSGTAEVHDMPLPGDEDLANLAAVCALRGRGKVYAFEPGEMPVASPVAALLRY